MGQRQLPQCPTVARSRSAVAVALVASILASRAVTGSAAQMCDGVGWRPIIQRVSDSRSRLTAGFATGVPCAQPGLDLENECAFQVFARSAQASVRRRASRTATGCWPFVSMSLRRGRQQTATRELETLPSARQTAPLPSFLRQPEASGLPWSYDRLTPPNLWSHVSQRRLPSQNPIGAKSSHRAYHQLVAALAVLRLYYSATFHHWSIRHARRAGH